MPIGPLLGSLEHGYQVNASGATAANQSPISPNIQGGLLGTNLAGVVTPVPLWDRVHPSGFSNEGNATGRGAYYDLIMGIPSLLAYWRLDETARDHLLDSETGQFHGVYVTTLIADKGIGGALRDDPDRAFRSQVSSAGYGEVPNNVGSLNPANMTALGWIAAADNTTVHYVLRKEAGTGWGLRLDTDGVAGHAKFYRTGAGPAVNGVVDLNDGAVHLVAGTHDSTTMRLYVDGLQVATGALAGGMTYDTAPFRMAANAAEASNTALDEVALFSAALDATTIRTIYLTGLAMWPHIQTEEPTDLIASA